MGNESIERRRTVHGGKDSALCVEVSAWRREGDYIELCNHELLEHAHGFGVYIRNPLAFHVKDFKYEIWHVDQGIENRQRLTEAFAYADALANHLGCEVVSQLKRLPAPAAG